MYVSYSFCKSLIFFSSLVFSLSFYFFFQDEYAIISPQTVAFAVSHNITTGTSPLSLIYSSLLSAWELFANLKWWMWARRPTWLTRSSSPGSAGFPSGCCKPRRGPSGHCLSDWLAVELHSVWCMHYFRWLWLGQYFVHSMLVCFCHKYILHNRYYRQEHQQTNANTSLKVTLFWAHLLHFILFLLYICAFVYTVI